MVLMTIIIALGVLLLVIFLDNVKPFLANIFILAYYLWVYANLPAATGMATFYAILAVFVLIMSVVDLTRVEVGDVESKARRFTLPALQIAVGLGLFGLLKLLSSGVTGNIMGIPSFMAAAGTITTLNIVSISLLGFVENRAFFSIYNLLHRTRLSMYIPIIGSLLVGIFPVVVICFAFALFHKLALGAVAKLIFVALAFSLFLISYIFFKKMNVVQPSLPADISHYLWNMSLAVSTFAIIGL